jgi:SAM-dependent methyltransferase
MDYTRIYNKDYFSGKNSFFYKLGYGRFAGFHFDNIYRPMRTYAAGLENKKVLDAGCAFGYVLQRFPHSFEKHGFDVSDYAIKIAKQRLPNCFLKIWNLETPLPYRDGFFDFITCNDVLEHLERPGDALDNIYQVLKKQGTFYVNSPNLNALRKAIFAYADRREHHISLMSHGELKCALVNAGFTVLQQWTFTNLPFCMRFKSNIGTESAFIVTKT